MIGEEEDSEPPGVGGKRRRDGDTGESEDFICVSKTAGVGYGLPRSPAEQN